MQTVVDESNDFVIIYLEDIIIFGDQLDIVWKVGIQLIAKLTGAGIMVNIKKMQFLV